MFCLRLAGSIQPGTAVELSVAKATVLIRFGDPADDTLQFSDCDKQIGTQRCPLFWLLLPNFLEVVALSMLLYDHGKQYHGPSEHPSYR